MTTALCLSLANFNLYELHDNRQAQKQREEDASRTGLYSRPGPLQAAEKSSGVGKYLGGATTTTLAPLPGKEVGMETAQPQKKTLSHLEQHQAVGGGKMKPTGGKTVFKDFSDW